MEFDLDAAVERAEAMVMPWEFSIKIEGVGYATRPITIAELGAFKELKGMPEAKVRSFVAGLFAVDVKHAIKKWPIDKVMAAALAVSAYFGERVKKKSLALAGDVVKAVAATEANSTSSG